MKILSYLQIGNNMKVLIITQARVGSTRLPKKVLKKINGETLLEVHINRILKSKYKLVIATTNQEDDDLIVEVAKKLNVDFYRGSVNDVLDRFYQTAKKYNPERVVRLTSDCPLIDPDLIEEVVNKAIKEDLDYCSNTLVEAFPDGQDIEVFKFTALSSAWENAKLNSEREHVTPFMKKNSSFLGGKIFKSDNYSCNKNYNKVRLTVDEISDFEVIEYLVRKLGFDATWKEYADEYMTSGISHLNNNIIRNEGYKKSLETDIS